jgi:hypothetical protein
MAQQGLSAAETCARVAGEVLQTERTYVTHLTTLHELYYKQLHIACYYPKEQRVIKLKHVLALFSNIEDILLINDALLKELASNAAGEGHPLQQALNVATIFLKMGFALMLYRKYLANYSTAVRTLHLVAKEKRFAGWLADLERQHAERLQGRTLESLLILPVQPWAIKSLSVDIH